MKNLWIAVMGLSLLASCANGEAEPKANAEATILPETLNQSLLRDSEIIKDCKQEAVLANFSELTCVGIIFPANMEDRDAKEAFAADLAADYAKTIVAKGWSLTTDWKLMKVFEKSATENCSTKVKIMAWVVDESKPMADRNFETSRLSFLRDSKEVCGDKRKAVP